MNAAEEPAAPLEAGDDLVPGYTVVAHIRRGSLQDVYEVWSSQRACGCIAKVLRPDRVGDAANRRRLIREARLLLRLSHPHIERAYETVLGPTPALILETLSGDTLAHLLRHNQRGLSLADVVVLGIHLSSAVQYLHAKGFLHLDLKPSNIITQHGVAKLLDLDIAQAPGPSRGPGTPQYMAPEQIRCEVLGPATDVWGIGFLLFEAATGQRPFASQPVTTHPQLGHAAEPLRLYRNRWPRALSNIVDAALRPALSARPTLHEVAGALSALVE